MIFGRTNWKKKIKFSCSLNCNVAVFIRMQSAATLPSAFVFPAISQFQSIPELCLHSVHCAFVFVLCDLALYRRSVCVCMCVWALSNVMFRILYQFYLFFRSLSLLIPSFFGDTFFYAILLCAKWVISISITSYAREV